MRRIVALAIATLLAVGSAGSSLAAGSRPFEAELHHFTQPAGACNAGVCTFVSYGYAFSNVMGSRVSVTVDFVWDFNTTPCSTLDPVVFTLVGETGSITIAGSGSVCPGLNPRLGIPQFFSITGEITGGTDAFDGISGTVAAQGHLTSDGPVGHMSGTASY